MAIQFSAQAKAEIEAIAAKYPKRQAALLPVLHLAQDEFGHLSTEVQALVADALEVPKVLVREVTSFYEMYHEHPEGQFHVEICTNIACHLAGADSLVTRAKQKLGCELGHLSEDGTFSLIEAECLASCGSAPMLKVGLDYYEYLTPEAFDALIEELRKLAPKLNGKHYRCRENGPHVGPVPGHAPKAPQALGSPPTGGPAGGDSKKKSSAPPPPKVEGSDLLPGFKRPTSTEP